MKLFTNFTSALALIAALTLTSCEKEEIELNIVPVNGVAVTLVPVGGGEAKTFTMSTPYTADNGAQYGELKQEELQLKSNTTYNATVTFFSDKTGTRVTQNENIQKEENVYSVTYRKGQSNADAMQAELSVAPTDMKSNGTPLGLKATITTGKAGVEVLHIDLNAEKRQGKSYMAGTVFNATFFVDVAN